MGLAFAEKDIFSAQQPPLGVIARGKQLMQVITSQWRCAQSPVPGELNVASAKCGSDRSHKADGPQQPASGVPGRIGVRGITDVVTLGMAKWWNLETGYPLRGVVGCTPTISHRRTRGRGGLDL